MSQIRVPFHTQFGNCPLLLCFEERLKEPYFLYQAQALNKGRNSTEIELYFLADDRIDLGLKL